MHVPRGRNYGFSTDWPTTVTSAGTVLTPVPTVLSRESWAWRLFTARVAAGLNNGTLPMPAKIERV